jgi:hypothetical protein
LNIRGAHGKSETVAVTPGGGDLYKTALAVDGSGKLWVFWTENAAWKDSKAEPNFELWGRSYEGGKLSEPVNLSSNAGSDVNPVAVADSEGRVWVAWQGERGGAFRILERHQTGSGWSPERQVSPQERNCWTPALAASKDGRVAVCWDTYEKGDYDVWVREYSRDAKEEPPRPVEDSPGYEARPAAAYDGEGRLWICWESGGPTWGKDWGAYERETGIGLYKSRKIGMRVWAEGRWMEPAQALAPTLVEAQKRKGPKNVPVRRPEAVERAKGEEAEVDEGLSTYDNMGRIAADAQGRIWVFSRSRQGSFYTTVGSV